MTDIYTREIDRNEAAKTESEIAAKYLYFALRQIMDRIDSAFPASRNLPVREAKSFSRAGMFSFLTDTAKDLREAYSQFGTMHNAYAKIPQGSSQMRGAAPRDLFITAKYGKKAFALWTPLAIKANQAHINAAPYAIFACDNALQEIPCDIFAGISRVQEYHVIVYPALADAGCVIDLDNIDTKVFGDPIFVKFNLDDNAVSLPTIISYSIFSDDLQPGFYTVLLPEKNRILTRKRIKKRLKMMFKSSSFFAEKQLAEKEL